jgi:hypothetical protein
MFRIKEVKVKIKFGIAEIEGIIVPSKVEQKAAWEIYVELVTRVTVIELGEDQGILREALSSFYTLFETTRDVLKKYGSDLAKHKSGKLNLALIAISMLNYGLRPLLSEWHPTLEDYEASRPINVSRKSYEAKWSKNKDLRERISEIRETINHYANLLAEIASISPIHNIPVIE